jgi:type II secretory pathway component PulC
MKGKWRKIVNFKVAFYFSFSLVFLFFTYFIFLYYNQVKEYIKYKETKVIKAPVISGISRVKLPGKDVPIIPTGKDIFSKPQKKKNVSTNAKEIVDYKILGVVKREKLFAIVYFTKDKKKKSFYNGIKLDSNTLIYKIKLDKVILKKNGKKITYQLFKSQKVIKVKEK